MIILSMLAAMALQTADMPAAAASPVEPVDRQGFIAIITGDLERSADWYRSVFSMETVNRIEGEGYAIQVMEGEALIVELIAPETPATRPEGRRPGLSKAGTVVADFGAHVARWRADGIEFFGHGRTFYDAAMDRHSVILLDPDGNRIQVFSLRCGGDEQAACGDWVQVPSAD